MTADADKTHAELKQDITDAEKDIITIQNDARISSRLQAGLTLLLTTLAAWCFTAADGTSVPGLRALPGIRRTPNERAGDMGSVPAENQDDVITKVTRTLE